MLQAPWVNWINTALSGIAGLTLQRQNGPAPKTVLWAWQRCLLTSSMHMFWAISVPQVQIWVPALPSCITCVKGYMTFGTDAVAWRLVGAAEAPLTPEVIEGFRTMGALAEDDELVEIDRLGEGQPADLFRSCRPFAENCGFTLAEAAQFVLLMDDETALQMGAHVFGSVADVFVNAEASKIHSWTRCR